MQPFRSDEIVNAYITGFGIFLEIYPVVPKGTFTTLMSSLYLQFFRSQDTLEPFFVNTTACEKNPLIASLTHFTFCVGVYYSDMYFPGFAESLYNNGKKYLSLYDTSSHFSILKLMVIFVQVYHSKT